MSLKIIIYPTWWKLIAPLPFRRPKTRQSLMYVRGFKPKSFGVQCEMVGNLATILQIEE